VEILILSATVITALEKPSQREAGEADLLTNESSEFH
jgi:hypothetical protein